MYMSYNYEIVWDLDLTSLQRCSEECLPDVDGVRDRDTLCVLWRLWKTILRRIKGILYGKFCCLSGFFLWDEIITMFVSFHKNSSFRILVSFFFFYGEMKWIFYMSVIASLYISFSHHTSTKCWTSQFSYRLMRLKFPGWVANCTYVAPFYIMCDHSVGCLLKSVFQNTLLNREVLYFIDRRKLKLIKLQ